jgi:predicted TIM-barrel fold metal-dependent hydrolase
VPVVIDHYGLYTGTKPDEPAGVALLEVLARPHIWIKLSAPYRVSADPFATRADPAWVEAFLKVAPDRCVWGSDWPHTPPHDQHTGSAILSPYRSLRYEALVDDFIAATGSAELAERILSDNPARLYGFE